MRRLAPLAAVLLALLLLAPSGAQAKHRSTCRHGGHTLARTSVLRVYEVFRGSDRTLYACVKRTHRRSRVARAVSEDIYTGTDYASVTANGRFVAVVKSSYDNSCKADCPPGYNPRSSDVVVYDAKRRHAVRDIAAEPAAGPVVSVNGAVAWLQGSGNDVQVLAEDSAGRRTLDTGAIDPKSLAIELTIVSWTKAGEERFARLR